MRLTARRPWLAAKVCVDRPAYGMSASGCDESRPYGFSVSFDPRRASGGSTLLDLGRREVANDVVFLDLVDDNLVGDASAGDIELDRFQE